MHLDIEGIFSLFFFFFFTEASTYAKKTCIPSHEIA